MRQVASTLKSTCFLYSLFFIAEIFKNYGPQIAALKDHFHVNIFCIAF